MLYIAQRPLVGRCVPGGPLHFVAVDRAAWAQEVPGGDCVIAHGAGAGACALNGQLVCPSLSAVRQDARRRGASPERRLRSARSERHASGARRVRERCTSRAGAAPEQPESALRPRSLGSRRGPLPSPLFHREPNFGFLGQWCQSWPGRVRTSDFGSTMALRDLATSAESLPHSAANSSKAYHFGDVYKSITIRLSRTKPDSMTPPE